MHLAFLSLAEHSLPPELGPRARCLAATVAERKAIDLYRAKRRRPTAELEEIPRARSAKLRVAERTGYPV